jgi:hypothetical protein
MADRLTEAGYELTDVTVLAYEKQGGGTAKIPAAYCLAVAETFGYPIEYALGLAADPRPPASPERAVQAVADAEKQLLEVVATLRAARRAEVTGQAPAPPAPPDQAGS